MTEEPPRKRPKMTATKQPANVFEGLALSADEIRLVEITPGSTKHDLSLQMRVWPLTQSLPFTALSYTWGGSQMISPVRLNGTEFLLMPNVKAFFEEILARSERSYASSPRRDWLSTRFWIDSICINQSDGKEKSRQVARMTEIFEWAENVLTWLGPEEEDSDLGSSIVGTCGQGHTNDGDGEANEFLEEMSEDDEAFNNRFLAMTSLPYWTRAWVIQEATTPHRKRNAIVWRGNISLELDTVVGEALLVSSGPPSSGNSPLLHSGIDTFRLLAAIKFRRKCAGSAIALPGSIGSTGAIGIYTLFSCMRSISSTDLRDRIYALLPLSNMAHIEDLAPDYSISVEALFQKVAICMIREESNLNILGFGGQTGNRNLKLPSWVPDWSSSSFARAFPRCSIDSTSGEYGNLYQASTCEFDGWIDETCGRLQVRGTKVDSVHSCSATRVPAGAPEVTDDDVDADDHVDDDIWVELLWKTFALQKVSEHSTSCSWREALAHTMCADLEDDMDFEEFHRGGSVPIGKLDTITGLLLETRELVRDITMWRRLFNTTGGYLGLGPRDVQKGDSICVLHGSPFPMVLRQLGESWEIVGEAYIHGLMDGEAEALGLEKETFVIV
ncbi:uncharacterized protein N0V89_007579 [Didymosphaeria variabile]|uniref:Heterokaryon incompatibility domain-containing protein n=1 Tax=Didymosphaeria variabile TaxID=1932322 RepID=A0A9W8XJW0_9PLEO|nr:uncharacterized protein N0V89_007579 [Didymosphaeria variabile]KAJ4352232.1 hypothetical protein N0V89_007579 [Didymosphaeria variabile]